MAQKVNPLGFRLGFNKMWSSVWYAKGDTYVKYFHQDMKIRNYISKVLLQAGVAHVKIERLTKKINISIMVSRLGVILSRKGEDIQQIKRFVEKLMLDTDSMARGIAGYSVGTTMHGCGRDQRTRKQGNSQFASKRNVKNAAQPLKGQGALGSGNNSHGGGLDNSHSGHNHSMDSGDQNIGNSEGGLKNKGMKSVVINISEYKDADTNAQLVAQNIASQIENRASYKKAMKRAMQMATKAGAQGIRINVSGRLNGAEIARTEWYKEGRIPLHTLRSDIDYGTASAQTTYGVIGIKVWIYSGEKNLVAYGEMDEVRPAYKKERVAREEGRQQ